MSSESRLIDIFLVARSVVEQTSVTNGGVAFPVDLISAIIPAVKANMSEGFEIHWDRKEWPCNQFSSALFRYHDHADILYSSSLNLCERRFAICKEAAHLLIDDDNKNHFTTDVVSLIAGLITSAPMLEPHSPVGSESMGVIAAIEILIPWKLRNEITEMQQTRSDFEIAEVCRIPEKFVNAVLKSNYGKLSEKLNRELDGK